MKRRALLGGLGLAFTSSGVWRAFDEIASSAKKKHKHKNKSKKKLKGSGKDRWRRRQVAVIDYTGAELDGYLLPVVQNWNAALGGGLRLTYRRAETRVDCEGVKKREGAIVVCNHRIANETVGTGATYIYVNKKSTIDAATVYLVARAWGTNSEESGYWWHPMGCHELGHALGLEHDYNEARSCMGTQRQTPGSDDVQRLKALYGGCGGTVTGPTPTCCGELARAEVKAASKQCSKKARRR